MNAQGFRQAVVSAIETWRLANEPALPAFYQNASLPDEEGVGPIWLDQYTRFVDAAYVTVGSRPRGRQRGSVVVNVYVRKGEGTAEQDRLLDSLTEVLRTLRVSGAVFGMPMRTPGTDFFGWAKEGVLMPFRFDSA